MGPLRIDARDVEVEDNESPGFEIGLSNPLSDDVPDEDAEVGRPLL